MGDRGHNRHGPKRGELGSRLTNVAWDKVYFHTKRNLHPSSRLVTIDVGRKLGAVHILAGGKELDPRLTQCRLG